MILVLGPSGVGKTMLIKQLEEMAKLSEKTNAKKKDNELNEEVVMGSKESLKNEKMVKVVPTQPTTGTNIATLNLAKRKEPVTVREVGGSMGPIWKNYYQEAEKLIYVIDIANPFQVSAAVIRLLELLSHQDLKDTPILLLLNKIDCFCDVTHAEMKSLLQLDNIVAHATQPITIIEASTKYGSGLHEVIDWILKSRKTEKV